ncbi:MAG: DNA-processing protein DprA [Chlamydiota bacterium]
MTEIVTIRKSDEGYPHALHRYLGDRAPEQLFALGDIAILRQKTLALFCSVKCPGNIILKTYDLVRELRDAGISVISGFHSPMEKECFDLLLRGQQPVLWCPAFRVPAKRPRKKYTEALSDSRLLIVSCFGDTIQRASAETTRIRNDIVAALSDKIFVAYADPDGKIIGFCRRMIDMEKPLLTFDMPANAVLLSIGARPWNGIASLGGD